MKIILIILTIFLSSCKLNKIVNHHGIHNLEAKSKEIFINETNINQIRSLLGPPSTTSYFDDDILIYLERKTSNSKLLKLGKKKLITNNVLLLEINNKGILIDKKFYDKNSMQEIEFEENTTTTYYSKRSFIYNFLSSLRTKIDDPLGKKRSKVNQR